MLLIPQQQMIYISSSGHNYPIRVFLLFLGMPVNLITRQQHSVKPIMKLFTTSPEADELNSSLTHLKMIMALISSSMTQA